MDDRAVGEVVAMQFAGGRTIAQLAEEWEREPAWVEDAIRQALLATIPRKDGGTKPTRADVRAENREQFEELRQAQIVIEFEHG